MIRIQRFGGVVTSASPYALPPGGMQQQVNFTLTIPGQLTSRAGSEEVEFDDAGLRGVIEQVFPFSGGLGQPDKALVIDAAGGLAIIDGVRVR